MENVGLYFFVTWIVIVVACVVVCSNITNIAKDINKLKK